MQKKIATSILIGFIVFGISYFFSTKTRLFLGIERSLNDALFYLREPNINEQNSFVSNQSRLIGFDDDSITVIGKWPWKRYVYSEYINKIEKFSPKAIMIDLFFEKPEVLPDYVKNKLNSDKNILSRVESAYSMMDKELTNTLTRYSNIYIDLLLMEQQRTGMTEDFKENLKVNESIILNYSQPVDQNESPIVFHSMEPILADYIKYANPVAVNTAPDDDGDVRSFPLYVTYKMSDGNKRNVFSVILSLLLNYYRIEKDNVILKSDKVILNKAKSPITDYETHQPKIFIKDLKKIAKSVSNPNPPKSYKYNSNLYNLIKNYLIFSNPDEEKIPYLPVHIAQRQDFFEILDNWEVFNAARDLNADKIKLILYNEKDIEIETPNGSFFYINYAGREKIFYKDLKIGTINTYCHIPTEGFKNVYTMMELPDIPIIDKNGKTSKGYNFLALEKWFIKFCEDQYNLIVKKIKKELRSDIDNEEKVYKYLNRFPDTNKYYFYHLFLKQNNAKEGDIITKLINKYPDYAKKTNQSSEYFINEKQLITSLMDYYYENFEKYLNKFLFSGGTAIGLGDIQQTSYSNMYGINVIINAFNTVITKNLIKMSKDMKIKDMSLDNIILFCLCMFLALLYRLINIRISSYIFIIILIANFLITIILFESKNFIFNSTPLLMVNIITFILISVIKLLTEETEKKFLKKTFGTYLAPELIDDMFESKTHPKLGGEAKIITAYFTDIQSFSTFSEILKAEQLVELLNEYLSAMTDILLDDRGTLDKYEGDAILGFFGAPVSLPDHAYRACCVAISMQSKLEDLRFKWQNEKVSSNKSINIKNLSSQEWGENDKWPKIVHNMRMRIGINTGEIVVGNMGSKMRMNYTMMGDPVNLAARLEAAAKYYGVYILISEYNINSVFVNDKGVKQQVNNLIDYRFIDNIAVVGKSEPVKIYEPIALKGELKDNEIELCQIFGEGIKSYLDMDWDTAIAFFNKAAVIERYPENNINPSKIYIKRCEDFKGNPPAEGKKWDRIYRLTKK